MSKHERISIRVENSLKNVLQRRANNKQHSLTETIIEILTDRLVDERYLISMKEIIKELVRDG